MDIKSSFIRKRGKNYNVIIEYYNEDNKLKQKSQGKFATKKEASRHLVEIQNSINKNNFIITKDIDFADRCLEYLNDKSKNFSPTTYETRISVIRVNIKPFFKETKLSNVTPYILQSFANDLYSKYYKEDAKNRLTFAKSVLNEAYRLKEIHENPCDFIKTPKPLIKKDHSSVIEVYDKNETRIVIEKLKGSKIEIPVLLMLTLGIRAGEACGLRWEDVDFNNNTISIKQNLIYASGKGIILKEPKTESSIRTLSAPVELMQKLKKWKVEHNKLKLADILEYEDLVCLNSKCTPYIQQTLRVAWNNFLEKNNIRKIKIHDLRHTHATMLVLAGTDFKTISNRLGHSDIRITLNRYSHVLEEMDKKASDNISNVMFN